MIKILVLDNYDSFTYNLVHYLDYLPNISIEVFRNNEISLENVQFYDKIVLSPGPGLPHNAGIMPRLIKEYAPHKPIIGICLGHQAIAEAFGGTLYNLPNVYHGISTDCTIVKKHYMFNNIPQQIKVGRYHSWCVTKSLPPELDLLAYDSNKEVMAIYHKKYDIVGVQFHPESVLTEYGKQMIKNWALH